MQGGIADLSLRELAAAIGTSHRMLLYHFGSREGLLAAVTLAVEEAERATLREAGAISADDARRFWARYSDPALWPQERLFFELYVHALRGRPGTEGFLGHVVTGWLEPLTAAIAQDGTDPRTSPAAARLSMAVTRGLLLDLLATTTPRASPRRSSCSCSSARERPTQREGLGGRVGGCSVLIDPSVAAVGQGAVLGLGGSAYAQPEVQSQQQLHQFKGRRACLGICCFVNMETKVTTYHAPLQARVKSQMRLSGTRKQTCMFLGSL